MADEKITQLPAATLPLAGTEPTVIVQDGETRQVNVDDLTAGRDLNVESLTATGDVSGDAVIASGADFVVGAVNRGVDFSINPGAPGMTSELLDWYEEGNWTPVIAGATVAGTGTYVTQVGRYTRIGRTVSFTATINWTAHTGTGNMLLTGLPYTSENTAGVNFSFSPYSSNLAYTANWQLRLLLGSNATTMTFWRVNGSAAAVAVTMDTAAEVIVTGTYSV